MKTLSLLLPFFLIHISAHAASSTISCRGDTGGASWGSRMILLDADELAAHGRFISNIDGKGLDLTLAREKDGRLDILLSKGDSLASSAGELVSESQRVQATVRFRAQDSYSSIQCTLSTDPLMAEERAREDKELGQLGK